MKHLKYIDTKPALEEFVAQASSAHILAIDTEFMREKTYYPQLCLIQIAADDDIFIIDPLALSDISDLAVLLENERITKVFHAATQDIEILLHEIGTVPTPLFDTQLAAALLGFGHQVGLGQLVSSFCGVNLKKGDSFTDWTRRPLSKSQLEYAAADVAYLSDIYLSMQGMLLEKGRLQWLEEDFAELGNSDNYEVDPYARYKHLKRGNQLNRRQLGSARELAAWRELRAQRLNIPRKWVLSDEQIVEACRKETFNIDDLFLIRGMREKLPTKEARDVVQVMKAGFDMPEHLLPQLDKPSASEPNVDAALDVMLALTRHIAKENDIALQTLASNADLTLLARGHVEESGLMKGWKKQLIGEKLLKLLAGDIALHLEDGNLVISKNN